MNRLLLHIPTSLICNVLGVIINNRKFETGKLYYFYFSKKLFNLKLHLKIKSFQDYCKIIDISSKLVTLQYFTRSIRFLTLYIIFTTCFLSMQQASNLHSAAKTYRLQAAKISPEFIIWYLIEALSPSDEPHEEYAKHKICTNHTTNPKTNSSYCTGKTSTTVHNNEYMNYYIIMVNIAINICQFSRSKSTVMDKKEQHKAQGKKLISSLFPSLFTYLFVNSYF